MNGAVRQPPSRPQVETGLMLWKGVVANGTTIALSSRDESGVELKGPVVVFQVSDARALAASLVARGAEILARRDLGDHGHLIAIREPSGNNFQLFEKPVSRT